ncbi:MAG: hypothetical protein IKF17_00720 [Clostridia bacterium]|nr:hypothetical protein [Clostridia bacterium]
MEENNNKHSEDVNISLGTTVFIAVVAALAATSLIVWISFRIRGVL